MSRAAFILLTVAASAWLVGWGIWFARLIVANL